MKIGFFDSGLGGLTILKATVKELPQYNYSYYGDTAHLPYGDKSEKEIYEMTKKGMQYLFEDGCLIVIVACNTASAETVRRLQQEFLIDEYPDKKILGIIVPTIEELEFDTPTNVTLLATKRTVESEKYLLELEQKGNGSVIMTQLATPELVPLIELNELETAARHAISLIEEEAGESEVVVLGCSHYTQIKDQLREAFLEKLVVISQDEVIPKKLSAYLANHPELESQLTQEGERNIHLTEHRPDYDLLMGQFLGGVYTDH